MRRRSFLKGLAATCASAPLASLLARPARADIGVARRIVFFYFPDGVPGPSQNGEPSVFHPTGSQHQFSLPSVLSPLAPFQQHCVFFRGLSLGSTDAGSHPGGAKKLLTAVDGGNGISLDTFLANTVGGDAPWRHLYLGAMANQNNASGDKHITYVGPGHTLPPEDNPRLAFERLFSQAPSSSATLDPLSHQRSVLDGVLEEMSAFRARLGGAEAAKLELHTEALREMELRLDTLAQPAEDIGSCGSPVLSGASVSDGAVYDPARFPDVLRTQIDLMVNAMACGLTKVGTLQASHHTSELIMSRFVGTEMHVPNYDMRSHQASHYGASHDYAKTEFDHFVKQRRWFVSQLAYLLGQLQSRPEGDGTMLDHSLVLLCTEVCDGNTHMHDDMPFVLAGGGAGALSTGRLLQFGYERHSRLLASLARAMGSDIWQFGNPCDGPLPGLLAS